MLKLFDRYVLKEVFPPFLIGLLVTAFVLLMNEILVLADLFIDKGVSAGVAGRVLVLLVPSLLAFAVPMAVLTGVLGALARLSADSEIVAFRTLGIGSSRLLRPLLLFGLSGWLVTSALAMFIAPRANYLWVQTMTNSVLAKSELRVNPLEFNESLPNVVLFVREVDPDKTWRDVFAYLNKDPREPRLVMSRTGRIHFFPEEKRATLELADGVLHSGSLSEPEKYSVTSFARFEEEIDVENLFPSVVSEKRVREKDIRELWRDVRAIGSELGAAERQLRENPGSGQAAVSLDRERREYRAHWIEIHKKFSLPMACLIFVLLGLPLGLMTGRGGRTSGLFLSLGIILLYYAMITFGEKLAMDGRIAPFLGMWGPDGVLAAAGALLFLRFDGGRGLPVRLAAIFLKMKRPSAFPPAARGRRARPAPRLSLPFPDILDRYVARKVLAILGFVLAGLLSASVIITFLERLDAVHRHNKPIGLLLHYVWFRIPDFLGSILPVAALTATLLALGLLARTNEVTAMKTLGISLYRMVVPVLLLAALVSGAAFLVQERLAPMANARAEEAWDKINDRPARSYSYPNRHWMLSGAGDRIYHYDYLDPASLSFSRLSVFDIDTRSWTLERRLYAERARLEGNTLDLRRGWVRDFSPSAAVPFAVWGERELVNAGGRSEFLREWKEPQQMTYGELRRYASEVRRMGFEATRLRVDLEGKLAFPLASLVMTILAIPFSFWMGKKGTLVGIGLSLVLAVGYWAAFAVLRSLGTAGALPPFLAAWGANLIFGLAGFLGILRLRT
jgi:LPS export ABC transporter permease LptF/LPS export ABC transporter permease LptG